MRAYLLSIGLLMVVAFSLASTVEPWFQGWAGSRTKSDNVLQVALGDSRRLFAKHFFVKADAYFHNGYYPTIYDSKEGFEKAHIQSDMNAGAEDEEEGGNFLGKPRDWIDGFGRNFYPSRHTHLVDSESGSGPGRSSHADGDKHDDHGAPAAKRAGLEREILPWLRLSAEMDPERVETYVVAAFWLRTKLGKVDEAEQFLRDGLRANPGSHEILFELGRIYYESRKDVARARNMLELSFKNWRETELKKAEPDLLLGAQVLNLLALLEREEKNYPRALQHYLALREFTPNKAAIQEWIDYLQTNGPASSVTAPAR